MNILENQFYLVKVFKKGVVFKDNIQRRYSDFDLLYEVLFLLFDRSSKKSIPDSFYPLSQKKELFPMSKPKCQSLKMKTFSKWESKSSNDFLMNYWTCRSLTLRNASKSRSSFPKTNNTKFSRKRQNNVPLTINIELARSKSIVDSTWGIIKDFFKINQTSKYTLIIEEVKKEKVPFENLLFKA